MNTKRRWLTGCGIGCGAVALIVMGACVAAVLYLQHTFRGVETAEKSYHDLIAELGEIDNYVPPPDGAIPAERVEVFLEVRESLAGVRKRLEARLADLPPDALSEEKSVLGKIAVGLESLGDLIDEIGGYIEARNDGLLERRMGLGEYVYIYCLAYYSWLGHSPEDGPTVRQRGDVRVGGMFDEGPDSLFSTRAVQRRYRRYLIGMTRRQLDALEKGGVAEAEGWPARLAGELRRLEEHPGHRLWQDGVPPAIEASLDPFRDRLEAAYSPEANRFELPLAKQEVPWRWD